MTAFALALALTACTPSPALRYENGRFIAEGWSGPDPKEGWSSVFPVTADGSLQLVGDYTREGSKLIFKPRFPPTGGVTLHASFRPPGRQELRFDLATPASRAESTTQVLAITPDADTWPANTLRMYITFSAPMSVGQAWTHIKVLDPSGKPIEKPFVEIEQELWDPETKRLTVLFDPGRIKRGLTDNETAGPPLVPGRDVTLYIDPAWTDARGAPLAVEYRRAIHVSPADRRALSTREWTLTPPRKPEDELVIDFHRPMDHALALRTLNVKRGAADLPGKSRLTDGGTVWRFTPDNFWPPGQFEIVVNNVIEDVAGNRLGKPFDVDMKDKTQSRTALPDAHLPFSVNY